MSGITEHTRQIKEKALELGFDRCGITPALPQEEDGQRLDAWLQNGFHAGMNWMEKNREKRKDPTKLIPGAKSVISLLLNYYNPSMQTDPEAPVISRYAYGKDYHKVIKKKLKQLFAIIKELMPGVGGRFFVDSAPVLEHAFARNAGLGWIGKNSLLLNREMGSYFFISELIIDRVLEYDSSPGMEYCGSCSLCVDECPTHAILPGRQVDAAKCISYLTIEHKGKLPDELKNAFYNRVFGCDICQDVCPWNRKIKGHEVEEFEPVPRLLEMKDQEWFEMDEKTFDQVFRGSAVKRAGFDGLKRNISFLRPNK